ncbi:MAG: Ig-like domain-containing protein [Candidatus Margulisiibacteriota bacterium]
MVGGFCISVPAGAALRQSANYKLQTDVSDCGGTKSTSTNYILRQGSAGQLGAIGDSDSANYSAEQGYIYTINTKPASPSALAQYKSDGVTPISWPGGYSNTLIEVMKASMSDPDPGDVLTLQIEVALNGGSFSDTVSFEGNAFNYSGTTLTGSVQATGMQNGNSYIWQARVKDQENFYSSWVLMGGSPDYIVDNASPEAPTLLSPSDGSSTNDATVIFTWSDVTTAVSTEVVIDTALVTQDATTSYTTPSALSEGSHTWKVRVKDVSDNWSDYSSSWDFIVDLVGPSVGSIILRDQTTLSQTHTNNQIVSVEAIDVSGTPETMVMAESAAFTGASWITYSNPATFELSAGDGTKEVYYKIRDIASNESSSVNDSIILDTVSPTAPTLVSPINGSTTNDKTPDFSWNAATDATSGVASNEVVILGGTDQVATLGAVTSYTASSELSYSSYNWKVRAKDHAQNWGDFSSIESFSIVAVPFNAIVITFAKMTPTGVALSSPIIIGFSAAADETSVENVFSVSSPEGAVTGTVTWSSDSKKLIFTPATSYTSVTTYVIDISGEAASLDGVPLFPVVYSSFETQSGQGDLVAPLITIEVGSVAINSGDALPTIPTFEITATDNVSLDASTLVVVFDDVVVVPEETFSSFAKIERKYTPGASLQEAQDTAHTIEVTVKDVVGNVTVKEVKDLLVAGTGVAAEMKNIVTTKTIFSPGQIEDFMIAYSLNKDAGVSIYMFGSGGLVWHRKFAAGSMGGKAGYNQVKFNGISDVTRTPLAYGIYTSKIIIDGKMSGKFYIVVYDQ